MRDWGEERQMQREVDVMRHREGRSELQTLSEQQVGVDFVGVE